MGNPIDLPNNSSITSDTTAFSVTVTSGSGTAVEGNADTFVGVHGTSQQWDAIVGESSSTAHAGVTGRNLTTGAAGGVGIYGVGGEFAGKFDGPLQVNGNANVTGSSIIGGEILLGGGLIAGTNITTSGGFASTGDNTVGGSLYVTGNASVTGNSTVTGSHTVTGDAHVNGTLNVAVDIILTAQDCAEDFDTVRDADSSPGTVMVVDDDGVLRHSCQAYDNRVAGVVSGAAPYRPGMILGRSGDAPDKSPIALIGRVSCKVDASFAAISSGDLLTTSPTPGHAMKATDRDRAFGAVIGKALQTLDGGRGMIAVLVGLQ